MSNVANLAKSTHQDGCPAERIESYEATRPDGQFVTVTRCVDCGGQEIRNGALQDNEQLNRTNKGNTNERRSNREPNIGSGGGSGPEPGA